jgi:hypothetical protein
MSDSERGGFAVDGVILARGRDESGAAQRADFSEQWPAKPILDVFEDHADVRVFRDGLVKLRRVLPLNEASEDRRPRRYLRNGIPPCGLPGIAFRASLCHSPNVAPGEEGSTGE